MQYAHKKAVALSDKEVFTWQNSAVFWDNKVLAHTCLVALPCRQRGIHGERLPAVQWAACFPLSGGAWKQMWHSPAAWGWKTAARWWNGCGPEQCKTDLSEHWQSILTFFTVLTQNQPFVLCSSADLYNEGTYVLWINFIYTKTSLYFQHKMNHLHINPLGPRPPVTAHSFALPRKPRPPGSGRLADTPY